MLSFLFLVLVRLARLLLLVGVLAEALVVSSCAAQEKQRRGRGFEKGSQLDRYSLVVTPLLHRKERSTDLLRTPVSRGTIYTRVNKIKERHYYTYIRPSAETLRDTVQKRVPGVTGSDKERSVSQRHSKEQGAFAPKFRRTNTGSVFVGAERGREREKGCTQHLLPSTIDK